MKLTQHQLETVAIATQAAALLLSDIREAHKAACTNESAASLLEMALFNLIEPANQLKDRLERINAAINQNFPPRVTHKTR